MLRRQKSVKTNGEPALSAPTGNKATGSSKVTGSKGPQPNEERSFIAASSIHATNGSCCPSSSSSSSATMYIYIALWGMIVLFFIAAIICQSLFSILLLVVLSILLAVSAFFFPPSRGNCTTSSTGGTTVTSSTTRHGSNQNKTNSWNHKKATSQDVGYFGAGKGHTTPSNRVGVREAAIGAFTRELYSPRLEYPQQHQYMEQNSCSQTTSSNLDQCAIGCANRSILTEGEEASPPECYSSQSQDYEDAGYKGPQKWLDTECSLQKMATDAVRVAETQSNIPQVLPSACSQSPLPCDMKVAWSPSFVGCSTTFIPASPSECPLSERNNKVWNRRLNDMIHERSIQSGEIWNPYAHMFARQKFAQFLSKDMVHRKSKYERPIRDLDETFCFGSSTKKSVQLQQEQQQKEQQQQEHQLVHDQQQQEHQQHRNFNTTVVRQPGAEKYQSSNNIPPPPYNSRLSNVEYDQAGCGGSFSMK